MSPETNGSVTAGGFGYEIKFTNLGSATCTLAGFPGVRAVDLSGNRIGAAATLFYFFHTQIQTTLALVPQLQERTARLIAVAAGQLAAVAALVATGVVLGASPRDALLLAALGTAVVSLCAAGPTLRYGAFPNGRVTGASVLGAGLIAATALHADTGPGWLGLRIALSMVIVGGIAWAGDFLQIRRERAGGSRPPRQSMATRLRRRGQAAGRDVPRMSSSRPAERSQA